MIKENGQGEYRLTALNVLGFVSAMVLSAVAYGAFGFSGSAVVAVAFVCGLVIE